MVNRGRPSKDCTPCKKRKLRCDLQKSTCGQCQRAKLVCYGYQQSNDLVIHDESKKTERRVRAYHRHSYHPPDQHPQLSWDVRARQIFFSLYIERFSQNCPQLSSLYARASMKGQLACSVDALSLALIASQLDSLELTHLANLRYVAAIRSLGEALHDSKTAVKDETLQSVMLLDLYEKTVNRNPKKCFSWMSHTNGALSLVVKRGIHNNVISPESCELASRAMTIFTISCGVTTTSVPESIFQLRRTLDKHIRNAHKQEGLPLMTTYGTLLMETVNLRAEARNGNATPDDITQRAKTLNRKISVIEQNLPQDWHPEKQYLDGNIPFYTDKKRVYGSYFDVYSTHYIAQVRNAIRIQRLELNTLIRHHSSLSNDTNAAIECISYTAHEICASAPHFIMRGARPDNTEPFSPLQRLQCCNLLVSLYSAASAIGDSNVEMKDWIMATMDYMVEEGLMKDAKDVVDTLRKDPRTDVWAVCAMTGCYAIAA